jgi:hypothetical protein
MTKYRRQVTLFSYTATTDITQVVATGYAGRRLTKIGPPYVLSWKATTSGVIHDSPSFKGYIQDSDDGVTFANVSAFTLTAITAVTTATPATKQKTYASQLRRFVRFIATTLTAGTWGSGATTSQTFSSTLTAVLTGEG